MRNEEFGVLACEIFFVTLRLLFLKGNSNYRTIATIATMQL
jgi:hypothetical protein